MKTKNTKTSETISETSFANKVKQFFSKIFSSIKNFFSNVFTNTKSEQKIYTKNNSQQHFSTPTSSPLTAPHQEPLIFEKKTIQPKVMDINNKQPTENEPISNIIINNEKPELNIDTMLEHPTETENQSAHNLQEAVIFQEDINTSELFAEPNFDDINNAEPQEVPSNETPVESPTEDAPSPANSATSVAIKEENIKEENIKGEEKMVQEKIKVNSVEELKNAVLNCLEEKNINKVVYDAYTKTLSIKIPTEDRNDDKMEVQRMLVFKLDEMKPQIEVEIMPLSGRGAYTNEVLPVNLKEMPSKYEAVFELLNDNKEFLAKELNIKKPSKQKTQSEADKILDETENGENENGKTHKKDKGPAWKQERKRRARETAENEKAAARQVEEEIDEEESPPCPTRNNRPRHNGYDYSR